MKNGNLKTKTAGAGVLAAVVASLCCITPVLAFVGGIGGIAATFSWLEPLRPLLIGITILVIGFAWYQQLKPKQEIDCDCEDETGKTKFLHSKKFLGIVTVMTIIMLAFPSYSHIFYPDVQNGAFEVSDNIRLVEFEVKGMTCTGCEQHVTYEVSQLPGIIGTQVSYESANALIKFDASLLDQDKITATIDATGYKVVGAIEKDPSDITLDPVISSSSINY
ncbi:MAG: mercuric transport protein MerTP [Bacteroidetes bacterium]|nr:mercuric transport protein MerTP [Bacteroidota bacterium]MDA1122376.1 mercuric transport protein MerTP [Bacteroidota bacterium]